MSEQDTLAKKTEVAQLGNLNLANTFFDRNDFLPAWQQCLEAIKIRPFHPEAFLLMAKIASNTGNAAVAQRFAQKAQQMAPAWMPPRAFKADSGGKGPKIDLPGLDTAFSDPRNPRLSVCLIVKNEEKFIGQCLRSVRDVASQIIVIDTGSSDRTVAIAREFGAEVYDFTWCDNFSAARNAGLVHANGDWVLIVDADEELTPESKRQLQQELLDNKVVAYQIPFTNVGSPQEGCVYLSRLFRNVPGACYEGRVHEQMLQSVLRISSDWGLAVHSSQTSFLHYGYSAEVTSSRKKPERNMRLLQQSLSETQNNPMSHAYILMHLGLETVRTGNLEGGIARYQEAIRILETLLKKQQKVSISEEFRASLLQQCGSCLTRAQRYNEVIQLFDTQFAKTGHLSASDHYNFGLALGQIGKYEESAREFRACLDKRHIKERIPVQPIVLGAAPHHCLAMALVKMGKVQEAERAYLEGIEKLPQSPDIQVHYARFKHQQGRSVDALKALHQLAQAHCQVPDLWIAGAEICLSHPQFFEIAMDWSAQALQLHPENHQIILLRAETLLLCGDPNGAIGLAAPLQENPDLDGRSLSTILCCQLLQGGSLSPVNERLEPETSKEFLDLYRRLISIRAIGAIQKINARLEDLNLVLPSAVRLLTQAQTMAKT